MIKLTVALVLSVFSTSIYAVTACPQAADTDNPGFCPSFQSVAQCHCAESGLPKSMCQDMNSIYKRMIVIFGSVQRACEYQKDTSTQNCIDDWSCYRTGGVNSRGALCSSTGRSCS
jgi:hypothetical protein